jgi:CRISPR-associated endonuclease Cas1
LQSWLLLDRLGKVRVVTGPSSPSEARLRRAQALALGNGNAVKIARELIAAKLTGQEVLVREKLKNIRTADSIAALRDRLGDVLDLNAIRGIESRAAAEYWDAWRDLPILFPRKDVGRVPSHWLTFGPRHSPLTGGPRLSVNPANSILNYTNAVAESECRLAACVCGLDPALGVLHRDTANRDSLALDLIETIRPAIEAWILDWLMNEPLRRSDFIEAANGNCRLSSSLCSKLSETAPTWGRLVAPWAEYVARAFWTTTSKSKVSATRLTQQHRREAKGSSPLHDRLISGNDEGDVIGQLSNDHAHRQMLLGELLPKVTDRELFWLHHAGVRLVPEVDLPWLIGRLEGREDNSSGAVELNLIRRIIDTQRTDQMDILWRACQTYPLLNAKCHDLFAIPLESEAARMLREDIQRQQTPERKPLDPPPQLLIERDLTSIEQGNMMEWIRLARDLSLTPTSTDWEDIGNPDLTCLPGWVSSTEEMRYRILSAALRYVNEGDPQNDQWFGTSQVYYSAIGGFQALTLLLRETPEKLDAIPAATWKKWVCILLKHPGTESQTAAEIKSVLLAKAYQYAPDEIIQRLMQVIDSENNHHGYVFVNREIDACWGDDLGEALSRKARESHLKVPVVGNLLQSLLKHNTAGSRELATSFVSVPPPATELEKSKMMAAIEAMLSELPDAGWPEIWPIIRDYPAFGRSLIESYANHPPRQLVVWGLTPHKIHSLVGCSSVTGIFRQ